MRIIKLEGAHFGQYKHLGPIHFPKQGTIGILGNTGSGKTTILNALEVALFGSVTGKKASELKYNNASKSQKWWVQLVFKLNDIVYDIYRHETTSKAVLKANGKTIQGGQTDVTEHITTNVLKMDQTAFLNAFYAKQDEVENLNKLKNEERKKEVSKLLRIDKIDKAIQLSRKDKNELNTLITEQEKYITPIDYFNDKQKEFEENANQEEKKQKQITDALQSMNKDYETNKKRIDESDKKSIKHNDLMNKKGILVTKVGHLENDSIPKLKEKQNKLKTLEKELPLLEESLESLPGIEENIQLMEKEKTIFERKQFLEKELTQNKTNLTKQKERIDTLKNKLSHKDYDSLIQSKENDIQQLDASIQAKEKEYIDAYSSLNFIKEDGKRKRDELGNIKTLGPDSDCPVCKRGLGDHHEHLTDQMNGEINNLLEEYKNKQIATNNIQKEKDRLNEDKLKLNEALNNDKNEKQKNENYKLQMDSERDLFQRMKQDYNRIYNELESIKDVHFDVNKYDNLVKEKDRLTSVKNKTEVMKEQLIEKSSIDKSITSEINQLDALKSDLSAKESELEALNFNADTFSELKQETDVLLNKIQQNEKDLIGIKEALKRIKEEEQKLQEEKSKNETVIKELRERKEDFSALLYLDEIYKQFKIDKLSKLAPSIASVMQELLSYLTDNKYDLVELDDHYNVFVHRDNKMQPLHLFSGGEKKLISLVQRLAISQIILSQGANRSFDLLALDEVLGSLDNDRQMNVLEALKKLNGAFKQVLMISHNQDLNDMFDYTLKIEQNNDLSAKAYWLTSWNENEVEKELETTNKTAS